MKLFWLSTATVAALLVATGCALFKDKGASHGHVHTDWGITNSP